MADAPTLEPVDQQICKLLAVDGRMSYADLGRATGLSTSAVHQRVKRLEQRHVITGYTAHIDYNAVGLPLTAFIALRPLDVTEPDDYPERLMKTEEIEACYSVAGSDSYLVKVRVADPVALEDLLSRIRRTANVSTHTTIVLSIPYENRPLNLSR